MDKARMEIMPRVWLDWRRCAFLEEEQVLAVSDLHLGYAWAHRFHGQMMPLQPDGVRERLLELCRFYKPALIALLGDIVHRAVPVKEIKEEFVGMLAELRSRCGVKLVIGNHDKGLKRLMRSEPDLEFHDSFQSGRFILTHGNDRSTTEGTLTIMGHEHPAIALGDGVRSARFPCFLVSERLIILPAFSNWAAGSDFRTYEMMSPAGRETKFRQAIAILNGKLLPIKI